MNQLEVGRKMQQIRCQYSYVSKITDWVCLQNTTDYSPFGVSLDGRTIERGFYRRGFNGMEKDDEVKGGGNSYDFGARMHDSRVGRFLSLDKFEGRFSSQSPYVFAGNTPICAIDENGDSIRLVTHYYNNKTKLIVTEITVVTEDYLKNNSLINWVMPGIPKLMTTEIGQETINQFINNTEVDVYIAYKDYYNNTINGESEGFTLRPAAVKTVLGNDCTFDSQRMPKKEGEILDYRKKYSYFDHITVTAKVNYFVVIHSSVGSNSYEYPEKVFHELYHVVLFEQGLDAERHHDAMGSEVLGNGKDDSKPIPKFRSQIKSATKTPDTSSPNNNKN